MSSGRITKLVFTVHLDVECTDSNIADLIEQANRFGYKTEIEVHHAG